MFGFKAKTKTKEFLPVIAGERVVVFKGPLPGSVMDAICIAKVLDPVLSFVRNNFKFECTVERDMNLTGVDMWALVESKQAVGIMSIGHVSAGRGDFIFDSLDLIEGQKIEITSMMWDIAA